MRGTFTHANPDFTTDLFHMADLGFTELSMEPVVCDPSMPYALTDEDLPTLFEHYEILALYSKEVLGKESARRREDPLPSTTTSLTFPTVPASISAFLAAARGPSILQLRPPAIFIPATSSLARRNTRWAISGRA